MAEEFGGASIFNGPSPSSDPTIVGRIVAEYITPLLDRPRRVLDIGGTENGFAARARLPDDTQLILVNPSGRAKYRDVADIPPNERFDFAMMFGVLMYFERSEAVQTLGKIRSLQRGSHPTLLLAEPDPVSLAGFPDAALKLTLGSLARSWQTRSFSRFHIFSAADAKMLLFEAGFTVVRPRDDLNPKLLGLIPRLPVYYVLAASL